MGRRSSLLPLAVSALLAGPPGFAGEGPDLAAVGDERISAADFRQEVEALRGAGDLGLALKTMTPGGRQEILRQLVDRKLWALGARAEGLDREPAVRAALNRAAEEVLGRAYRARQAAALAPGDGEARAYYDAHREEFRTPGRVRARHLLVGTREEAETLLRDLRGGADFAGVARAKSIDPVTRERGGELGWVPRGLMVRAFEDALFALEAGEVSGVVETSFGFHVVRADEVEQGRVPDYPEVRDLARRRAAEAGEARLREELAGRFPVSIHAEALEGLDR